MRSSILSKAVLCLICLIAYKFSSLCSPRTFEQKLQTTLRAEVTLVNVVFTAMDRSSHPVRGLTINDFQIFEDKKSQKIEYFSSLGSGSETPLTIVLAIDTSESVKDKLDFEKATAIEFFKEILRPSKDFASIIQFDSDVDLVQDFTQKQDDLVNALNHLEMGNSTALYDAIYLAANEKLKKAMGRRVMVVITDGEDTASKMRKEDVIEAAQKNDVLIYGIGVHSENFKSNFRVLKRFADETGGAFFSSRARHAEIQAAFRAIREEIQGQYSLAYTSANKKRDGSFRSIKLRCKVPGVQARTRRGYYASKSTDAL